MNLLADENVDAPIVAALRGAGHRVRYVLEPDPGIDDPRVLALGMPTRHCCSPPTRISASWCFVVAWCMPA